MPAPLDLTGHVYGKLTVIQEVFPRLPTRKWECLCSCGNTVSVIVASLRRGNTRSCGCAVKEANTRHGDCVNKTTTRLFRAYSSMLARCNNTTHKNYHNYGGKGVSVCPEWLNNYIAFKKWALNNGYRSDLSLDRIKCAKVYSPATCRWADSTTQSRNRDKGITNTSGFIGVVRKPKTGKYQVSVCVNKKPQHIGMFDDPIEGAKARDAYIIKNNLENFMLNFK